MVDLVQTPAWKALLQHKEEMQCLSLGDVVLADPQRLKNTEIALDGLRLNYALNRVTPKTIELLVQLAHQQKLEDWRARMFGGDKINITENRAALHTALRQTSDHPVLVDGHDVIHDVRAVQKSMASFVGDVREGRWLGVAGMPIRHVVNIGIGGSDLGPRLVVRALDPYTTSLRTHFVANADAFDLLSTLKDLNPAETLFVIVSKTFTTQETLLNAQTARDWLTGKLGAEAVKQHFVAVSSNLAAVKAFGIEHVFPIWDWVGGRFSLWSAVGVSIALSIGMENFLALCRGAAAVDQNFLTAPLEKNMPVVLALLGIWHRNFLGAEAQVILPYGERLREMPRYLQQMEMESNGKSVTRDGDPITYGTAPVIFGECGSVGQHSFHQWMHQGSDMAPVDFIGFLKDDLNQPHHHKALLNNMMAQAVALVFGQSNATSPYDRYAGGRSSNLILLDRLDPYHLGMLLALYEHKVFVQGVIWNVNSFDQPGVELGKRMARDLDAKKQPQSAADAFLVTLFSQLGVD